MKRVIILRGVPGSGKSTFIGKEYPEAMVVSADHFFVEEDGVYRFDGTKIQAAHGQCFRRYIEAIQTGKELIVVDNTSLSVIEIAPYVAGAEAFGYDVEIVSLMCDPVVAAGRNVHQVSTEKVQLMAERMEKGTRQFLGRWKHREVKTC